jgi:hypothetical protein
MPATLPQPLSQQPASQGVNRDLQLPLRQLLGRQRGAKVGIFLSVCRQNPLAKSRVDPAVRRLASRPVNHARVALDFQTTLQTTNVPHRSAQ